MVWLSTDPETISFYWFDQPGGISTNTPPVCVCVCSRGKSLPAGCWDVLKTADGGDRWTSLRGDSGVFTPSSAASWDSLLLSGIFMNLSSRFLCSTFFQPAALSLGSRMQMFLFPFVNNNLDESFVSFVAEPCTYIW